MNNNKLSISKYYILRSWNSKLCVLLRAYILVFCFFIPLFFSAQTTLYKHYTQEDGLNMSYGYNITQDHKGFVWIGGDDGLFRFDGTEFKQYKESNGYRNIEVVVCESLASGELFIASYLHPSTYLKNNKLFTAENNPELGKIQLENAIPRIARNDSMNQLFIFQNENPKNVYIYRNGKVTEFPVFANETLAGKNKYCFLYDFPTGYLYYLKDNSRIMAINIHTRQIRSCNMRLPPSDHTYGKDRFFISCQKNTLVVYELTSPFGFKKINAFKMPEKIYQIFIDARDRLWVCLQNGGAWYFNQSLRDTVSAVKPVKFLDDHMINGLLRDRDGNVWFNSKNNGLFFLPQKLFNAFINLPVKNNASHFTAIGANKASIFLGQNTCRANVYHAGKISEIVLDKNNKYECRAVFANERVAIFGQSDKAFLFNLSDHKLKRIAGAGAIKNIVPYDSTSVLLCTASFLHTYNFATGKLGILLKDKTYTALPYGSDSLFAGTFKDLYKINVRDKTRTLFLKNYYFNELKQVRQNLYAGATRLNGVLLFNNRGVLRSITQRDGLASNQVKKIEVENEHTLWASTGLGLARIDITGGKTAVTNFTKTDGLPSDNVSDCVIKNDTIYVATSNGLGIFSIKALLRQDKAIHKEVIINTASFGKNELVEPVQGFTATYPDNTVVFNLSFPDYTSQGKIRYRYKTEGLNQDWQVSTSSRIILNSLPPGRYTFKVYGVGYSGKQSDRCTALAFKIEPLFWQSRWFYAYILLTLSIALILVGAYFIRKRRNKKMKALLYEKKIAELELQAIKAQINPHFIYNCLNSIQFLLYKKDYGETEDYLDRFSKMIRQTMQYSEKTFMPIQEEIDYLALYLDMEKLRFKGHFKYAIHVSGNVDRDWKIPSLLIQPFVENAIKHGIGRLRDREGFVEVRFEYTGQRLVIVIRDNGTGISHGSLPSKKAGSFGILLSRKRIDVFRQLFDTDITLEIHDLTVTGQHGTEIKLNLNLLL